jgi:hypothetical protein
VAAFVPLTGVAPADLFEDLSRDVVEAYRAAEASTLRRIQRAIDRQLETMDEDDVLPDPRLQEELEQIRAAIRNTEAADARLGLDPNLVDDAVSTAVAEGSAAAADRIGLIDVFPKGGPLTATAASSVVQVALDLRSSLSDVKQRILRFEDDAYRRIVARSLPEVLLGTTYSIDQQRNTVARWLSEGIPGFVDKGGRQWSTGAYVEMATRTGFSRAYTEATVYRQQQVGLDLVTVVVGASACRSCAQWIGAILSTSGQTGTVVLPHATTGKPTTVRIRSTLAHARATSHLNGPNCRCIVVAYLPGLSIPAGATAHDPEKEAARDRQRELERRLRRDKTRLALSPDEDEQARLRGRIRGTQAELREHIAKHDLPRKAYREQPAWAGGDPKRANGTPPRPEPTPPTPPRAPAPPAPAPEAPRPTPPAGTRPTTKSQELEHNAGVLDDVLDYRSLSPKDRAAYLDRLPDEDRELLDLFDGETVEAIRAARDQLLRDSIAARRPETLLEGLPPKATTEEIRAAFEARHGIPTTIAKFPTPSVRAVLAPLSELLDEFPDARLTAAKVMPLGAKSTNTLAQVTQPAQYVRDARGQIERDAAGKPRIVYFTPELQVNAKWVLDADGFLAAMKSSAESGHFTGDPASITLESAWRKTMTHEFLHVLDVNLQAKLREVYRAELDAALAEVGRANKGKVRAAKEAWTKANVSVYGQGSDAEGVAEAFEDYRTSGDAALPFSKLIGPKLEAIIREEL